MSFYSNTTDTTSGTGIAYSYEAPESTFGSLLSSCMFLNRYEKKF